MAQKVDSNLHFILKLFCQYNIWTICLSDFKSLNFCQFSRRCLLLFLLHLDFFFQKFFEFFVTYFKTNATSVTVTSHISTFCIYQITSSFYWVLQSTHPLPTHSKGQTNLGPNPNSNTCSNLNTNPNPNELSWGRVHCHPLVLPVNLPQTEIK